MPTFEGRTALVTGGNSGIGLAAALELARHGAQLWLGSRTAERGNEAIAQIKKQVPGSDVRLLELDLASLASVTAVAERWQGPLHLLVNNAGVMAPRSWRPTEDGFELQFGTNHLGHFALTGQLLPALLAAGDARVVTVSSLTHRNGGADVLQGNPAQGYRPQRAYANSKLANLLFGLELQRRAEAHAAPLTSAVAHPGVCATHLLVSRDGMGANPVLRLLASTLGKVVFQPPSAGAQPTLYAATEAAPGSYSGPQWPGEIRGPVGPARISPTAADPALAAELWDRSEELTGVSYKWS